MRMNPPVGWSAGCADSAGRPRSPRGESNRGRRARRSVAGGRGRRLETRGCTRSDRCWPRHARSSLGPGGRRRFQRRGDRFVVEAATVIEPALGGDPQLLNPRLAAIAEVADRARLLAGAGAERPEPHEVGELLDRLELPVAYRTELPVVVPSVAAQPNPAGGALEIGHSAL